jgi:GNAT superfamily N-acetyltransferase
LDRHQRGRHPNSPTRVSTTVIPCRDDAECEKLGAFLADRIYEFNANATGYFDGKLLGGCVRNDAGEAVAGFNGHTWGGCCELSNVWVDERYRGQGLGAALLRSAEAEAVARGCVQVVLATHSFQAPGFYERLGYERKYVIEGRPKGYADIIYVKVLQRTASSGA